MPTLEEFNAFVSKLVNHDWHYAYKDDVQVREAAQINLRAISEQARTHSIYHRAYLVWHSYVYTDKNKLAPNTARLAIDVIRQELVNGKTAVAA